jgi:hypothetical protein
MLYHPSGDVTVDENGNEVPVMELTDGYHVNVRVADGVDLPIDLVEFLITPPVNPKRVWV